MNQNITKSKISVKPYKPVYVVNIAEITGKGYKNYDSSNSYDSSHFVASKGFINSLRLIVHFRSIC